MAGRRRQRKQGDGETVTLRPLSAENAASIRILEKLGFRRTAVRAGAFLRAGQAMDIWAYEKVLA